jgi:tetratricopeptide (TPR) repeat protein
VPFVIRAASALLLAGASVGLYWSIRFARADWLSLQLSGPERVHATELAPNDADTWIRLADLRSVSGPGDVAQFLQHAAASSPARSHTWIQLGLDAETKKNYPEAQRSLARAVEVDHDFIPLWTLTNYYFRRGDAPNFFVYARRTLAWASDGFEPVFRMCWMLSSDGAELLNKVVPDREEVIAAYLGWLDRQERYDAAPPVALRLLHHYGQESTPALLAHCDHLISSGRAAEAAALWNELNERHRISSGPIAPQAITNGDFHSLPVSAGFDWHVQSPAGVQVAIANGSLNLDFLGTEPDHCEILTQPVLLHSGTTYRLSYSVKRSGLEAGAGLRWAISDLRTGSAFPSAESQFSLTPPDIAAERGNSGEYRFVAATAKTSSPILARIALVYDREPASARMQGWIQIQKVRLDHVK